ncbi:MAG: hypothetical protein KDD02_07385 [Phaeodactylibacter sp.]|nr:hypothetical protein [Phaeodactylibacter sp.]MCB9301431.1 hypothetical protein [Lewinellaceae bacterium]
MKPKDIKSFYRQSLPHIQPLGASFFVTFRLKDSIPRAKLFQLRQDYEESVARIRAEGSPFQKELIEGERVRLFTEYDNLLDAIQSGPHYLKQPEVAQLVKEEIHRFDGALYRLICYCIMSNHVHILIDTSIQIPECLSFDDFEYMDFEPLQNIMKRIKGPTAIYANRILNRSGKFWQRESYDRYVRNEKEFWNIVAYILENPVKAKLTDDWRKFPHSYLKELP